MNKFKEMLELQDKFNERTVQDWKSKELDWTTAILTETAELLDSTPWKWWKDGVRDYQNYKVELIDIWHFIMALGLERWNSSYLTVKYELQYAYFDESEVLEDITTQDRIKMFLKHVLLYDENLDEQQYNSAIFVLFSLMEDIDMLVDDLYTGYTTKNVLNILRQNNGYKEGTYIKTWNGKEDNEVVFEIASAEDRNFDELYKVVQEHYTNNILTHPKKGKSK